MLRKLISISLSYVFSAGLLAGGAAAQSFDNDAWLKKAFIEPLPSKVVNGKPVSDSRQQVLEQLRKLATSTFLRSGDVKNFSEGLQYLAGNYYYLDDRGVVQLVGTTSSIENKKMEIKDGIVLRAIVNDKFRAGFKLPFLSIDLKNDQLAELTVRDVATAYGDSNIDRAACRYPLAYRQRPEVRLFYITAATLTTVTKKTFSKQENGGAGIISVLNLGGETYSSREFEVREPVISISAISVNPVAAEDQWYCSEYVKVQQNIRTASIDEGTKKRSVGEGKALKKEEAKLKELEAKLKKVVDTKPTKQHLAVEQKMRGAVLPVAGL